MMLAGYLAGGVSGGSGADSALVNQTHRSTLPGEQQGSGEPGYATSDHCHISGPVSPSSWGKSCD
ncbi:hypothetical protein GCM10027580_13530 [Corynebacterium faecale]